MKPRTAMGYGVAYVFIIILNNRSSYHVLMEGIEFALIIGHVSIEHSHQEVHVVSKSYK